jgi:hypothetical protein
MTCVLRRCCLLSGCVLFLVVCGGAGHVTISLLNESGKPADVLRQHIFTAAEKQELVLIKAKEVQEAINNRAGIRQQPWQGSCVTANFLSGASFPNNSKLHRVPKCLRKFLPRHCKFTYLKYQKVSQFRTDTSQAQTHKFCTLAPSWIVHEYSPLVW